MYYIRNFRRWQNYTIPEILKGADIAKVLEGADIVLYIRKFKRR